MALDPEKIEALETRVLGLLVRVQQLEARNGGRRGDAEFDEAKHPRGADGKFGSGGGGGKKAAGKKPGGAATPAGGGGTAAVVSKIAASAFRRPDLSTKGRDALDFKDAAVWEMKRGLEEAYRHGGGDPASPAGKAAIEKIAKREFGVDTLETRNWDTHDFKEISGASIQAALTQAIEAGRK